MFTDILGHVYPGQTLQTHLCAPFNEKENYSFVHKETQNIIIQNITCKVAHKMELIAELCAEHKKINFTIISNRTDQCSFYNTTITFTYKYYFMYDSYHVQLVNGIINCDSYLVNNEIQINNCYINELVIKHPANS